jgi:hypothetical protein
MTYGWAKIFAHAAGRALDPPPRVAREATDMSGPVSGEPAFAGRTTPLSLEDISEACWGPGRRCSAGDINDGMDQGQPTSLCNIFWIYFYKTDPTNQLDGIALLCASSKNNRSIAQWGSAQQAQHVALPAW